MGLSSVNEHVSERAQHLLKVLIEQYIRQGQPVASKALVEASSLGLSSATVRHIMADLEEQGFLVAPHTSAGRIPTSRGYRFFVDSLLTASPPSEQDVRSAQKTLHANLDVSHLVHRASHLLSSITQLAGLVTLPRTPELVLKQIEFLPLSGNRVLTILVMNNNEVENRIIYTDQIYSREALQQFANYLTTTFADQSMKDIRDNLLTSMQDDRKQMDGLMQSALQVADKVLAAKQTLSDPYVMAGEANLLQWADSNSFDKIRDLFNVFSEKQRVLDLLDRALVAEGIQVFIGEESGHPVFEECSVISTPYHANGRVVGVLGVIGPTRMHYNKVISVVDMTAKLLSAALSTDDKNIHTIGDVNA